MAKKTKKADAELPAWMRSPPTPEKPEHVEPGPEDEPAHVPTVVVECGGRLWDRMVVYEPHRYERPAVIDRAGPILSTYLREEWQPQDSIHGAGTDEDPENREIRASIVALATEASAGRQSPGIERRRAWRVVDWQVRTGAAAMLELAGWLDYAAAFRTLPAITGPELPRGAPALFREALRATNKASTDALRGVRPYRRDRSKVLAWNQERTRRLSPPNPQYHLAWAVEEVFPSIRRAMREDRPTPPLGRATLAGAYARICIDHDPRIPDAEVSRVLSELAASARALLGEIVAMGKDPENAQAAA